MDNAPLADRAIPAGQGESPVDRLRRLAREAEMIAEARASLDAGRYVDGDEVEAWLDSIANGRPLPLPAVRRR